MRDYHLLPKFRDGWSYLYVEHCKIDQEDQAIAIHDAQGRVPVPCATLAVLMLGPGTSITHAAIKALADNGCLAIWCGEEGVRFYAQGMGETRKAHRLLRQARLCSDPDLRLQVVRRLYQMRFQTPLEPSLTLKEIRGKEGIRVREAYAKASKEKRIEWKGRSYSRGNWKEADPVNRALSAANSCLYGICHAAIISAGFSTALGFIHTGKLLSFVYDVADLYKTEISIPLAFNAVAENAGDVERWVRQHCRDAFREARLLARVIPDIEQALAVARDRNSQDYQDVDLDGALPGGLWDPELGEVNGGIAYGESLAGGEPCGNDDT